jgi:hypothetical protein
MADGQAEFVLRRLMENGAVNSKDVSAVVAQVENEIESLEERLRMLRQTSRGLQRLSTDARRPRPRSGENGSPKNISPSRRRRRKLNLSPERRVNLQLQGHYLSLMRRMPKGQRDHYKKLFRKDGLQAAIVAMESAAH